MSRSRAGRTADTAQGSRAAPSHRTRRDMNVDEVSHKGDKGEKEAKGGLWNKMFSHGAEGADTSKAGSTRSEHPDRHARGRGKDADVREAKLEFESRLPFPPEEAEEALCKNCLDPHHIIYINPKTGEPYQKKYRRRPEICHYCDRFWPENKPYSAKMLRQIEERLERSKYNDVFFCDDCDRRDSGRGIDDEDLEGPNNRPRGRKRALLIGINYEKQTSELKDCANDVKNIIPFLEKHGYDRQDMVILLEDWEHYRHPTREEIIRQMELLVKGAKAGECLFLHFSGHGDQVKDKEGDEIDGRDEGIYPVDYHLEGSKGILNDDTMNRILTSIPEGVVLTCIFDSCHSGSVLDLPYALDVKRHEMVATESRRIREKKKGGAGTVILWSGCKDTQTSKGAKIDGRPVGAMSYAFIRANDRLARKEGMHNYLELHRYISSILKQKGFKQKPQLSCNKMLDLKEMVDF